MFRLQKQQQQVQNTTQEESTSDKVSLGQLQFQKELKDLTLIPQCKMIPSKDKNDIMNFTCIYTPEKESYWYGGKYEFSISIPDTYNIDPPKVFCNTKIYHPNIDLKGNVCLNILKNDWKPTLTVSTVIAGIYFLFTDPNPNDPLNHEAATVMRDDLDKFIDNVKKSLKGGRVDGEDFPKFK